MPITDNSLLEYGLKTISSYKPFLKKNLYIIKQN